MSRVKVRPLVVFVAIAWGLAWLVASPLYFGDGLQSPFAPAIAIAMMVTPAIAALIVLRFVDRPASIPRALGLWPLRPVGRLLGYLAVALVLPVALVVAALPIGAALGVYPADFTEFSAFKQVLDAQQAELGGPPLQIPMGVAVAFQFVNVIIGAFISMIPALGEELGWRGYLLPKLMPLGTVKALVISGVVWGLWHAPLILLGYNYAFAPGWAGLLLMCGLCIVMGGVFGWLRLASDSVWPAALAHGALNSAAGFSLVFARAGEQVDTVHATILGWSGWIVPAAVVAVLLWRGAFRSPAARGITRDTDAVAAPQVARETR